LCVGGGSFVTGGENRGGFVEGSGRSEWGLVPQGRGYRAEGGLAPPGFFRDRLGTLKEIYLKVVADQPPAGKGLGGYGCHVQW